ncbi:MAG: M4 family metallopeptidase [Kofleriaceae bacterium]
MNTRQLLSLCLLLPAACSSGPPDELRTTTSAAKQARQPRLLTGESAIELLDGERGELFKKLQELSDTPVEIVIEAETRSVVSISGHVPTEGDVLSARALGFIEVFQKLIDPLVPSHEYVLAAQDPSCFESTVVFDRLIDDIPVLGSRITIHFDAGHAIESVTNGVAPVPSREVEVDPGSIEGAQPLEALLPERFEGEPTRTKVYVPAPDLSGVVLADLVGWSEAGQTRRDASRPVAAVAIGGIAITGKLKVATTTSQPPVMTTAVPKFLDKDQLPLPEYISYRDVGGVGVNSFPWEHNPVEMTYRFLEEHPSLVRTFAARCQFAPRGVVEDPGAPGVYFVKLQQKYGPLPVFGSELVVMQEGLGKVMSVAGRTLPKIEAATTPSISVTDALDAAAATLLSGIAQDPQYKDAVYAALNQPSKVALGVLPAHKQDPSFGQQERLVYEVQRGPYVFYVDALTAAPIGSRSLNASANIVTDAGGGSELGWPFVVDEVDGIPSGLISPRNFDNLPTRPGGNVGVSLSKVTGFYGSLGWIGSNGAGANWTANTNVAMIFGRCPNAFYDGVITHQTFFCLGEASDDVVGHELTHGVVAASSKLWFADQSGALNEAYADIMGNLIAPDATPGSWLVGELTSSGAGRDMANPTAFNGDPGHMSAFQFRGATCNLLPWSCDSGFVHANAGIVNRAHVMLSDGIPDGSGGFLTPGIGRAKMGRLMHFTMTRRLFSDARLHDAAVATRDICEMFVARGVTDTSGAAYTLSDCDQVTAAFNKVGLNGQLDTGWQEPTLGYAGSRVRFGAGETTPGGCPVSNIVADLSTISGNRSIDLDRTTPLPATTSFFFGTQSITLRDSLTALPIPLGTSSMFHIIDWTNTFGFEPTYASRAVYPASCPVPINQITRTSPMIFVNNNLFGAFGTNFIGATAASWGPGCTLRNTDVEVLAADGSIMKGFKHSVTDTVVHWVVNWPVNYNMTATIISPPPGGPTGNLVAAVSWNYDIGRGPIRIRLRYTIDQAVGSTCTP